MMLEKPLEYWAALAGMAIYVASRDAESEALSRRIIKTVTSGLLAFGTAPTLAGYVNDNEIIATVIIMAAGLFILDTGTALVADREFIKEMVRRRMGGSRDE